MSVNKVILVGNLGRDPEVRATPSGQSVCNFSLATTEPSPVATANPANRRSGTRYRPTLAAWQQASDLAVPHAWQVGGPEHRRRIVEVVRRYPGETT